MDDSLIPLEKRAAVAHALNHAFGVTTCDQIQRITRGLSSDLVFRIVVNGSPFVLRIMTRIDERNDPARIFACMNAAADAGLAPRVRYAGVQDGVSIIDFVDTAPFSQSEALVRMPAVLRRLHALPPFPKAFNYVTAHNGFTWRFRTANLLPKDEIEEVFTRYVQVCDAYPRLDSDVVSCHSDLKPENILFDGQRVWLVDWQAAFVNDRYFDLAVVANFLVENDAAENAYLVEYFGQPPSDYQRARFFLMRQVMHMFYAAVFLTLGAAGKPIQPRVNLPSFREFHDRIWAGEVNLAANDLKIVYGRLHFDRLLENVRDPRFDESLRIVSNRHSSTPDKRLLLPDAPAVP